MFLTINFIVENDKMPTEDTGVGEAAVMDE